MEGNNVSTIEMSENLKGLIERFESQDMGDLLEQMPEVQFEIDLQPRKGYFRLEQSLASTLMRLAQQRGISAETLLNLWVQEKLLTEQRQMALA